MKTILIAGHARLPSGMAAQNVYDSITITAEVDTENGIVIKADCTLATEHSRQFIHELMKGYQLKDGIEPLISELTSRYLGKASSALTAALRDLYNRYVLYLNDDEEIQ